MTEMTREEIERIVTALETHARDCQHWIDRAENYGKKPEVQLHEDGLRLSEAAAALRQLLSERELRPIEMAPEDKPVLLYGRLCGEISDYFDQDEFFVGSKKYGSWSVDGTDTYSVTCYEPKGWLPLPPSPDTKQGE